MPLRTSIYDHEIDNLFDRFQHLIGDSNWRQRVKKLKEEIRGNKFLRHHLLEDNEIAYQLCHCSDLVRRYGALPVGQLNLAAVYPALAFVSHCLSTLERMNVANRTRAIGRIRGAFRNPEDMRALQLEFTAGLHFVKRGHRLSWPELESGGDTYDLLVEDLGPTGLEVECKAVSQEKGRRISTRDALDFWNLMQRDLTAVTRDLHGGLSIVITLPDRLPTSYAERQELSKLVARAIVSGQGQTYRQAVISLRDFDVQLLSGIDWNSAGEGTRGVIESITGTENRHGMVTGRGDGAVICVIQSNQDDNFFDAIQKTAKRAATKQLTGTRPGLILLEFAGISPEAMLSLAEHDTIPGFSPTSLRRWVSNFLSNCTDRDHVVGIGFLSKGAMRNASSNVVVSTSSAYVFPRRDSRQWDDAFGGLFNEEIESF